MKKFFPILVVSLFIFSGCGQTSENSVSTVDEKVETPPVVVQKEISSNTIKVSPDNVVGSIEKQIASKEMFTYELPIANSVITKREVSGFLDDEKTGKISRVTVGVASVNEFYYYEKGQLVAANIEAILEGKKQLKEIILKGNKIVSYKNDGVESMGDSYLSTLEEEILADGEKILTEFVDRKLNNE